MPKLSLKEEGLKKKKRRRRSESESVSQIYLRKQSTPFDATSITFCFVITPFMFALLHYIPSEAKWQ